ncbi:MAG TPA: hypothetical protein VHC22_07420 [Pirellulales bacterium]|nr:hypothetical protein [Pirellulales bacterium]
MYSRWFNVAVVGFWLLTMGWLVRAKILPSLIVGEPPTYRKILARDPAQESPASWSISLNDAPIGWAEGSNRVLDNGVTEMRSHVRVTRLPLAEITPGWMSSLLNLVAGSGEWSKLRLAVDARSSLEIDPLGRPIGLYSRALLGDEDTLPSDTRIDAQAAPGAVQITLQGTFEGSQLKLKVRTGQVVYNTTAYLPPDALMGDAMAPSARLPDLRVGQTWTMPVYSPLRPPTAPVEMLQATVERREPILWHDQVVSTYLVVFRNVPGVELSSNQTTRAKAWVHSDGTVLKQEINLISARLTFERY